MGGGQYKTIVLYYIRHRANDAWPHVGAMTQIRWPKKLRQPFLKILYENTDEKKTRDGEIMKTSSLSNKII